MQLLVLSVSHEIKNSKNKKRNSKIKTALCTDDDDDLLTSHKCQTLHTHKFQKKIREKKKIYVFNMTGHIKLNWCIFLPTKIKLKLKSSSHLYDLKMYPISQDYRRRRNFFFFLFSVCPLNSAPFCVMDPLSVPVKHQTISKCFFFFLSILIIWNQHLISIILFTCHVFLYRATANVASPLGWCRTLFLLFFFAILKIERRADSHGRLCSNVHPKNIL